MKKYEVQQGYIILSQAKLDGLTTEEKHNVISVARKMKSQATEFEDFIKDTQERVREECNMSLPHFQVIMGRLRKNNIIIGDKINPRFIPNIDEETGNFQLLLFFELK